MKKRFAPCHGLPFPLTISLITFGLFVSGCQNELNLKAESSVTRNSTTAPVPKATHEAIKVNNAAAILALRQVPILCYHQVRDWRPTDSKVARTYIVPPAAFQEQMKALADAGYQTILPNELYHYLLQGKTIPAKSVMLTFDDSDLDQYTVALPEMNKYGFKGAFFIMTVSLGRPNYMTKMQVKELADAGHTIGSHTWDHHSVKQYSGKDWAIQIEKPTQQLESITGKPVEFFAYPFGLWNKNAIPELKKRGFTAAFQLAAKRDEQEPLFTIRRIIVPGSWSGEQLTRAMVNSF